jgi:hypothetical protein
MLFTTTVEDRYISGGRDKSAHKDVWIIVLNSIIQSFSSKAFYSFSLVPKLIINVQFQY